MNLVNKPSRFILAIESSCDETAAAVSQDDNILANVVATQVVHARYGGVVPELASRAHQQHIIPVVEKALNQANISKNDLAAVAYTNGPGLLGALLVGSSFARSLALVLGIPSIPVNHMEAHVMALFAGKPGELRAKPAFPFLCLTVSGGHTQIVKIEGFNSMEVIGRTLDDAAGEAFDKVGKLLGLPYPAGPELDKLARNGNPRAFAMPAPRVPGLDFSFSGLKTHMRNLVNNRLEADAGFVEKHLNDICASLQHAIVSILMEKLEKSVAETGIRRVGLAGGVSANSGLREAIRSRTDWETFIPPFEYCTDNAAMVAVAGFYALEAGRTGQLTDVPFAREKN